MACDDTKIRGFSAPYYFIAKRYMQAVKKIVLTLVFLFSIQNYMFGQSACELLKQVSVSYCNAELIQSIETLDKFIQLYPNHELNDEVHFQIANIRFELKNYEQAQTIYCSIIQNNEIPNNNKLNSLNCPSYFNNTLNDKKNDCRRIVFPTDYNRLKHLASLKLSEISYLQEDYAEALEYLKNSDNKFPYQTSCGTGAAEKSNQLALSYNNIYKKLNRSDLALEKLLEQSFEMSNRIILEEINKLLKEKYTEDEIASEIKNSINSLKVIPVDSIKRTIERYYITFFDKKIEYHNHVSHISSISIKEKITKSTFFSLISK